MHNGFLTVDAEKMSKSIGNVLLLHDLVQHDAGRGRALGPAQRPLSPAAGLEPEPAGSERKNLDRLYGALGRAMAVDAAPGEPPAEFLAAIHDDLNTPGAIASLFALSSEIERGMTAGDHAAVAVAKSALLGAASILGVLQADPDAWFSGGADDALKAEVEALLAERVTARADKNWAEADRIRDRLTALNVVVMDGPNGATWRMKE
jgi:cysteinyl-tRNA synthetase